MGRRVGVFFVASCGEKQNIPDPNTVRLDRRSPLMHPDLMAKDAPELTPDLLLHGYSIGIFPMAEHKDDPEVFWVDPKRRGILPLNGFHVSRSLARAMRNTPWRYALNANFDAVLAGCADRSDTWISREIAMAYSDLHKRGFAHSFELYDGHDLVGGVYGVALGAAFFGESMFSYRTNASKIALAGCVEHLARAGFKLFDTQFITPHLASLGGIEVSRATYHNALRAALDTPANIHKARIALPKDVVAQLRAL